MFYSTLQKLRPVLVVVGVIAIALAVIVSISLRRNIGSASAESQYIQQDISKADFISLGDFDIRAEQDEDALFKIIEAKVHVISGEEYRRVTGQPGPVTEVISKPRVVFQNLSDKTVVALTLIVNDKGAGTKFGLYIKEQSIKPGHRFTVLPENFIRVGGNPAANPKFWLDAADKTQVVVRVVAYFEDGSKWANREQRQIFWRS